MVESTTGGRTVAAIAREAAGGMRFTVYDDAIKELFRIIGGGRADVNVGHLGICYPLRLHPARKVFLQWMSRNWTELQTEHQCENFTVFPFDI